MEQVSKTGITKGSRPARGAFAEIGRQRGIDRQLVKYHYDNGNPEIVAEVVQFSIEKIEREKKELLAIAETIKNTVQ